MYLSSLGFIVPFINIANCLLHQQARNSDSSNDTIIEFIKENRFTQNFIRHSNYQLNIYGKNYKMENPLHNAKCWIDLSGLGVIAPVIVIEGKNRALCVGPLNVVKVVDNYGRPPPGFTCSWRIKDGKIRLNATNLCLTRKGPILFMKSCKQLPVDEWTFIKAA